MLSAALITGTSVSYTPASVYCSQHDNYYPIVIDTGASVSATPILKDFVDSKDRIIGEGPVEWLIRYMFGNKRRIRATAYYVYAASTRLFSPQTYFNDKKAGSPLITHDQSTLMLKDKSRFDFPYQELNLPTILTEEHFNDKALTFVITFEYATVMVSMDVSRDMNKT
jgi:hypothetical protein